MRTHDIDYRDGAVNCCGFVAYDDKARDKRPGVLVFTRAIGPQIVGRNDWFSERGFVVAHRQ